MFGTRLNGRDVHASARYINTKLSPFLGGLEMLVGWCLKLQPPFFPPKQNMEIKAGFRMKHKKNMVSGKDILFKSKWLEGRKLRSNLK